MSNHIKYTKNTVMYVVATQLHNICRQHFCLYFIARTVDRDQYRVNDSKVNPMCFMHSVSILFLVVINCTLCNNY